MGICVHSSKKYISLVHSIVESWFIIDLSWISLFDILKLKVEIRFWRSCECISNDRSTELILETELNKNGCLPPNLRSAIDTFSFKCQSIQLPWFILTFCSSKISFGDSILNFTNSTKPVCFTSGLTRLVPMGMRTSKMHAKADTIMKTSKVANTALKNISRTVVLEIILKMYQTIRLLCRNYFKGVNTK